MPSTDRVPSHRFIWLAVAALMGCSDAGPSDSEDVPGVYIAGVVHDSDGNPVPHIQVTWRAWPAPDSAIQGGVSDFDVSWFGRTDSQGRFSAHVGYYSETLLDSLDVGVGGQDCWGLAPADLRERSLELSPGTADTVLSLDLTLERMAPRGRLVPGPVCAPMIGPPPSDTEDWFTLWIDEVGDSIRGRWLILYSGSRGSDYGRFSGTREGNTVTLELEHDEPWGTCTGFTVEIPVGVGDTLGTGTYPPNGCQDDPVPLRFVQQEAMEWPFP
jgi:hypothetical protein